ncbi:MULTISPECIES: 5-bromo-4-chloroindolyl phosphate hydrolysis family protein [Halocynthiibacter]|uniref:5-bromo-4-chloroindolyl phosphate hydrolysis family protein n=1 Tax=Halocynthiibacter halioticoli TaxID=2986804 RepID=A0AAE3IZJ9_9RHOB|nr:MULTISPECIES: 5-bromo-4-chloroindolyl phosphate hydrolysis family protein [Halocynthiibacter]MCV6825232.1 5-bromo-4-chloroindolyl phosphate hydrolysis family protein [Halocynthiibacter halioticoli]MCW4058233.1 5-bromo-4-chloroindolyl phosphate hydrolysis family protein [Halocynthiibacter sp. SDUM655004]
MAQRFGGKYSPNGATEGQSQPPSHPFRGKKPARAAARLNVLFFTPLPLALLAFFREPAQMALSLLAVALLLAAAWLTREGVLAHEAYDSRRVARKPAFPRKIFGSVLTGCGLGVAGLAGGGEVFEAGLYFTLGSALHLISFGPDPLKSKGTEGADEFQQDRVARAVAEAEKHLEYMSKAIRRAEDRQLIARVEQFQTVARDLFRTVEEDPRDLSAARRYMGVYLMGARDATTKFADIYSRTQNQQARLDYENLLTDLETNFAARTRSLLEADKGDLDVEIEVLRERLAREGV